MKDEDLNAWLAGVQPLRQKPQHPDFGRPRKQSNLRRIAASEAPLPSWTPRHAPLNLAPLPEQHFHRLCRGQMRIERELDLHGWHVDEALRYVRDALEERRQRHWSHWHIIHGKGRNRESPLKIAIWDMLPRHPAVAALAPVVDSCGEVGGLWLALYPWPKRF